MHIEKERYLRFKKYEYFKELKLHKMANHLKALKKEENTFELIKNRSNKEVVIKQRQDSNVLGGVVVKYEDKLIDMSLKNQLSNLAKRFG